LIKFYLFLKFIFCLFTLYLHIICYDKSIKDEANMVMGLTVIIGGLMAIAVGGFILFVPRLEKDQ